MPETRTRVQYGVFVWKGEPGGNSSQVLLRVFQKAETVGIWRTTLTNAEQDQISDVRRRTVTEIIGDWEVMN